MRKIVFCLMATILTFTIIPLQVNASERDPVKTVPAPVPATPAEAARVLTLESRLKEIDAMTKSEVAELNKKELRKEVKEIKHELRTTSGGVYLSAGALILIVLLLILLL